MKVHVVYRRDGSLKGVYSNEVKANEEAKLCFGVFETVELNPDPPAPRKVPNFRVEILAECRMSVSIPALIDAPEKEVQNVLLKLKRVTPNVRLVAWKLTQDDGAVIESGDPEGLLE